MTVEPATSVTVVKAPKTDIDFIVDLIEPRARVLDLGCGTGELLKALQDRKKVFPQGIEISEEAIYECISKGLPVYHGDLDEGLADYNDAAMDYVIMTNVIQVLYRPDQLIREAARVGKKVILSFPNFAHWRARFQLGFRGEMPRTKRLPYEWYDSPNIHLTTTRDFKRMCRAEDLRILEEMYLATGPDGGFRRISALPNLRAEQAVFVICR